MQTAILPAPQSRLRWPARSPLFRFGLMLLASVVTASLNGHFLSAQEIADSSPAPQFRAAFVDRDITPDIGMEQPGGYGKAYHTKLHDPCRARIGVFHDGRDSPQAYAAVISLDLIYIREPIVETVRQRIEAATGIPATHILIHATHSHSSGPMGILPGEYDHADEFVQDLAYNKSTTADPIYTKLLEDQMVQGVTEAFDKLAPARFGVGRGSEPTVAFNRRFLMKNGMTVTHPRPGNPDIIEPAEPVDPEVGVFGVWNEAGEMQGCIVNFVCHATASPGGISANYIAYVEKAIRGMFGEHVTVVFLAGASGDVTQVDNLTETYQKRGAAMTKLVGGKIGAEAVKVLLEMTTGTECPIAVRTQTLTIPHRKPRAGRYEKARAIVEKTPQEVGLTNWLFAKEIVLLQAKLDVADSVQCELQAMQLGPVVIAANPAEYFCQYGLDIKAGSPFPYTFVASLANGCIGYVPTLNAFGQNGGGYETRLTEYSNLVITAGDTIAETSINLTQKLKPGPVPAPEKIPTFRGTAWEYGNVPPEVD